MFLHVIYNDNKFVPGIMSLFDEAALGESIYSVVGGESLPTPVGAIRIKNRSDFLDLLHSRTDWDGIIFNPLVPQCWPWLNDIPAHIPVVWYRWGYEAYDTHPKLRNRLYMPETRQLIISMNRLAFIKTQIKDVRDVLKGRFRPLRRVDFLAAPEKEEFELYQSVGLLSSEAEWVSGSVGSVENFADCASNTIDCLGPDIRVGHSANSTANHIEAFRLLATFDLSGRKVVVPLSYGDASYRQAILQKGSEILGDCFEPILELMPLLEYNQLMNRCGFVVMNHLRQQGGGNIVGDLWRGAKVYMNNTTSYRFRKRMGESVELIEDQTEKSFFTPKPAARILKDREILLSRNARSEAIKATQAVLEKCKVIER